MKDSFLIHLAYEESIKELSDEDAGKLLKALFQHENQEEEEPDYLSGEVKMAYIFIRNQLDRERKAYDEKCEKLSANASKRKQKKTKVSKCKQMQANEGDKDKVEDEEKVKVDDREDKDNEDVYKPSLSSLPDDGDQGERDGEDRFSLFWEMYPKKSGKAAALKAWSAICPDDMLFEKIMTALALAIMSDEWTREGGRFIPYPARWLNEARWEDIMAVSNGPPGRRAQGRNYSRDDYSSIENRLLGIQ